MELTRRLWSLKEGEIPMKESNDKFSKVKTLVIYIHGKGGNAEEALHYKPLFKECDVIGFDYHSDTPQKAKEEFPDYFEKESQNYDKVIVVANSIGAYFAMSALSDKKIEKAYFISPVVNMEKLISDMLLWAKVSEKELMEKGEIKTDFGETLSWDYLSYVRSHPVNWSISTHILYGENDNLTSFDTISDFAQKSHSSLTIMKNGEHWFHTENQMEFLDNWIRSNL